MIFRPIRELLSESLEDKIEITTFKELEKLLDKPYYEHPLQISWRNQGWDDRINSDSYLICCKMPEYDHPQAAGYLHDNPEKLIK